MLANTHPLAARPSSVAPTLSAPTPLPLRPEGVDVDEIIGQSDTLRYVMSRVEQVADTDASVLLCGETGTGKGLIASAIHRRSRRRDRPFVVVNCATLPAALIESELFGRERGAFTGAHATQPGRFEMAHRGTMFLDEIGELPLELQPKLLRVLQSRQLEHLGSPRTIEVDVRIIAATNRDLLDEVKHGRFRRDLYYRLNVFPITVPSLRDRREDIPPLVQHLVARHSRLLKKPVEQVPPSVIRAFEAYDWPGNIRELENVIQRAIILSSGPTLELKDALSPAADPAAASIGTTLVEVERHHIMRILDTCRWRIEGAAGAAQLLAMKSSTLRSRMLKLGISRPR